MNPSLTKLFIQTLVNVLNEKKKIHCASPEKNLIEFGIQQWKKIFDCTIK
jgi:hypothetical protein